MAHENMTGGFGSFLSAFLLGATAGAAIALLTTPRSGRETRAHLKDAALNLKQRVEKAGARTMKAGQAAYEQARGEIARSSDLS